MSEPDTTALRRPQAPMQMFWVFSKLALQGFGGVIAIASAG